MAKSRRRRRRATARPRSVPLLCPASVRRRPGDRDGRDSGWALRGPNASGSKHPRMMRLAYMYQIHGLESGASNAQCLRGVDFLTGFQDRLTCESFVYHLLTAVGYPKLQISECWSRSQEGCGLQGEDEVVRDRSKGTCDQILLILGGLAAWLAES